MHRVSWYNRKHIRTVIFFHGNAEAGVGVGNHLEALKSKAPGSQASL